MTRTSATATPDQALSVVAADDISAGEPTAEARALAREWFALGAVRTGGRVFTTLALCFAALLWADLTKAGFFRNALIVFTLIAVVAAVASVRRGVAPRWLAIGTMAIVSAIVASALANHDVGDLLLTLSPVIAASALGWVAYGITDLSSVLVLRRIVVDVACLTAILATLGVSLHLTRFAELQAEGWRANATISYANAAALVMLVGLLCACAASAQSHALADDVRAWLLVVGILATQSRSAVLAIGICFLLLCVTNRAMARTLSNATLWALVAFVGLLPSVQDATAKPYPAAAGLVIGLVLLVATNSAVNPRYVLGLRSGLGIGAALTIGVLLRTRVNDTGSNSGRLRLLHDAVHGLSTTGWFGSGPSQLASFSRGHRTELFVHNDIVQFAVYYGVPGVAAFVLVAGLLTREFWRGRRHFQGVDWSLGVTTCIAVGVVALVDFPLEVPLITAMTSLVIGSSLRQTTQPAESARGSVEFA